MKAAGLGIRKHTLDNEASDEFKQYIRQQQIQFELVPPGNHRCNKAERAIQTIKAHFISILAARRRQISPLTMVPPPGTNGTHIKSPSPIESSTQDISICPRPRPPQLHEKAICTTRLRNPSPCQPGGPKNMGHTIGCRVQSRHIDAALPMFLGVHHEDTGNKN